ncbi:salivary glue protein Sgs-4-like [Anopheles ziemanni]|uniref:salivary glue protein Sgs-4-like n=1 Tax=Anopheles coustani TaxID=139045 RepID=UPI0026581852|nr:salivary glue protein Sgs-4-like [Anopheles coustani]XP_058178735.1 salivary glue protein Sgs-4-like [Anopheles ziemanni]
MKSAIVLTILLVAGTVTAASPQYFQCSGNEVLQPTPPCCEPTCDCDCSNVVCNKLLVYQPTCVCASGYVRLNGECVPQSCCPTTPPPCETTTPVYPPSPSCGCGQYPCSCGKPPQPYYPAPCETTPAPCGRPAQPYYPVPCETTPAPCETTTPPCETTTPPCETTTPPCETPAPPTCAPCEELVYTKQCCEPTCDNNCSGVSCPLLLVEEPTCACRSGLVRYQGHCVEPSACPRSASRYRLYVPKTASCACNREVLLLGGGC